MGIIKSTCKGILKVIRNVFSIGFTLCLIAIGIYIYARYIEPKLFIVRKETIVTRSIQIDQPIKIVQFSDVHLGSYYSIEAFDKVIEKINEQKPDLIIFTGDLIDDNRTFNQEEEAREKLAKLEAPLGKFAVYGNHDHGGNGTKRYKRIMEGADFILLDNDAKKINLSNGAVIHIIGVNDALLGEPNFIQAFKDVKESDYNLFVSHAPDLADEAQHYPVDLQLSGHSHGGQVKLPIIGAPFTPPYAQKYIKGKYTFEDNKRMTLFVSSGIGTSQLPLRFMNIPELCVLTLQKA